MTIKSYFFDSVDGDRAYSAVDFSRAFDTFLDNGVVSEDNNGTLGLAINSTSPTLTIGLGKAIVTGHFVEVTAPETVNIPAGTYSGMIVVRVETTTDRKATIIMKTDRNPTQTTNLFELPLYHTYVLNGVLDNTVDVRTQGGARTINRPDAVTWAASTTGTKINMGQFAGTGKPIILYLTANQPTPSTTEHRVWIQIDDF